MVQISTIGSKIVESPERWYLESFFKSSALLIAFSVLKGHIIKRSDNIFFTSFAFSLYGLSEDGIFGTSVNISVGESVNRLIQWQVF